MPSEYDELHELLIEQISMCERLTIERDELASWKSSQLAEEKLQKIIADGLRAEVDEMSLEDNRKAEDIDRLTDSVAYITKERESLRVDLTRSREVNLHNFRESIQALYNLAQDWREADKEVQRLIEALQKSGTRGDDFELEVRRLSELFFEYAKHGWDCDHELKSCDCGFEKALATLH